MTIQKTTKIGPQNIKTTPSVNSKLIIVVINQDTSNNLNVCIPAVLEQTYKNFNLILIDNNSVDKEGIEFMHNAYDSDQRVTIITNTDNRNFAKAANQGIRIALSRGAKYISIVDPNIVLSPDYYEKLIAHSKKHSKVASTTGKIYLFDSINLKPTDIIDSAGLFAYSNRRIIDAGQGLVDDGKFNEDREIFGASGICPLYNMEALEDTKIVDEYFDEDFGKYKEDADLAWRFLLYGWKSLYCPHAIAYHTRGQSQQSKFTAKEFEKNKKKISKMQKQISFRNQLLMQAKNELWGTFRKDFWAILSVKLATPFYMTFAEPCLWKGYFGYLKKLPKILKKRKIIMKNKKISAREMSKWFKKKEDFLSQNVR